MGWVVRGSGGCLRAKGEEDEEGGDYAGDENPAAPGVPVGVAVVVAVGVAEALTGGC